MNDVLQEVIQYLNATPAAGRRIEHSKKFQRTVFDVNTNEKLYRFGHYPNDYFELVVYSKDSDPYHQKISRIEYDNLKKAFLGEKK